MRTLFVIIALVTLSGCASLGEAIKEKKYTLQIHETPYYRQTFGYNNDYGYVGFMISGSFGRAPPKHVHSLICKHNIKK